MNKIIVFIRHFLKLAPSETEGSLHSDTESHTAAFTSTDLTEELHKGKRRLKENYTSHWDLDYLPREEVESILARQLKQKRLKESSE